MYKAFYMYCLTICESHTSIHVRTHWLLPLSTATSAFVCDVERCEHVLYMHLSKVPQAPTSATGSTGKLLVSSQSCSVILINTFNVVDYLERLSCFGDRRKRYAEGSFTICL